MYVGRLEGSLRSVQRKCDVNQGPGHKPNATVDVRAQAEALFRRARGMREALEGSLGSGQREFEDVVGVLVAAGALEAGSLTPLPLGEAARQLSGENELWLATVLSDPAVQARAACQIACRGVRVGRTGLFTILAATDALERGPPRCCLWGTLRCSLGPDCNLGDTKPEAVRHGLQKTYHKSETHAMLGFPCRPAAGVEEA